MMKKTTALVSLPSRAEKPPKDLYRPAVPPLSHRHQPEDRLAGLQSAPLHSPTGWSEQALHYFLHSAAAFGILYFPPEVEKAAPPNPLGSGPSGTEARERKRETHPIMP